MRALQMQLYIQIDETAFDAVCNVQLESKFVFFFLRACIVYESTLAWIDCCMDIEGQ